MTATISFFCLLVVVCLASGFQEQEIKPIPGSVLSKTTLNHSKRLDSPDSQNKGKALLPAEAENKSEDNGLVEVKEDEIPEGAMVYVLEEPVDQPVDGEILKTANNIVFRPLFRYRSKQEAQRRNSNRIRRRYFIPSRSYRQAYPYYYNRRYYG